MKFKIGEIADVKILDKEGNVLMYGEMYNVNSTSREIELAKRIRELEKQIDNEVKN